MNKEALLDHIKTLISDKLEQLDRLISDTRASNNDTKSSMGDKYETSREMLQQEINNLSLQRSEVQKQWDILSKMTAASNKKVVLGSLVKTNISWFYISISTGIVVLDDHKIMTVSPLAPLAVAMMDKIVGETINFNNIQHTILEIL